MAVTPVPTNLIQKAWAKDLWKAAQKDLYFQKFMGTGPDSIIQRKDELKKEAGDRITIPLMMKLTGAGITGDNTLQGNEEALIFHDFSVQVDQIRHAVRMKGKMEEQKTQIDMRNAGKEGLKIWLQEKIDAAIFTALTASPTAGRIIYGGAVSAEGSLAVTDKFTCAVISKAKRVAQLANPKIRPVRIEGKDHYALVIHPYQARDLKSDPLWLDAQAMANTRGADNPIFTGALGTYDGIIIHEHENISLTATGNSSAQVAHGLLLGAQAGVMAVAAEPFWEEDDFDYKNQMGFATGLIYGVAKSLFNSVDFAVVQVMTGCAND
jgi:N4-gp56 family major capsid protein